MAPALAAGRENRPSRQDNSCPVALDVVTIDSVGLALANPRKLLGKCLLESGIRSSSQVRDPLGQHRLSEPEEGIPNDRALSHLQ